MKFADLVKRTQKLAIDNSPAILTAIGVTGALTTAYLTGKASFKAAEMIREEADRTDKFTGYNGTLKQDVKLVWKLYIPAAGTAVLTVTAIVAANHIGSRRAAAIAAAYTISEKAFEEYKEKVVEKMGATKEQAVRDEVAQDRVDRNPVSSHEVIIAGSGQVLCFDEWSGRYFQSDMETIRKAQNDTNYQVLNESYASLSDFYERIGLPSTSQSDEIGWNTDRMIDLKFSTTLAEDGRPCLAIDFGLTPIRGYYKLQ